MKFALSFLYICTKKLIKTLRVDKLIHFDCTMKKLPQHKVDFDIREHFLSELIFFCNFQ